MGRFQLVAILGLKAVLMSLSLVLIQLSFFELSQENFLNFNKLVFLLGLQTVITYSVQVSSWKNDGFVSPRDIFFGIIASFVLSAYLILDVNFRFALISFFYLIFKYFDRIAFNSLITKKRLYVAYAVACSTICLELIVWLLSRFYYPEDVSRFLLPSLAISSVGFLGFWLFRSVFFAIKEVDQAYFNRSALMNSFHSLFLLLVIMSDRVLLSRTQIDSVQISNYLLLFSYAGSVYALGSSLLEYWRGGLFVIAKQSVSLMNFHREAHLSPKFFILFSLFAFAYVVGNELLPYIFSGLSAISNLQTLWLGLLVFFYIFSVASFYQAYFLARSSNFPLLLSWIVAFSLKCCLLFVFSLEMVIILNIIAGLLCVAVLMGFWGKKNA